MKIRNQVTFYFLIILVLVAAGIGFMFNRIHMMDVTHLRLKQEWEELQLMTTFLNDIDHLMGKISIYSDDNIITKDFSDEMTHLIQSLEHIRLESIESESFEEEGHVEEEKRDFILIHEQFSAFIRIFNSKEFVDMLQKGESTKAVLLKQLEEMRAAGIRLQGFYLEGMDEAVEYAQKTRKQIFERAVIVSLVFLAILAGMAAWFIALINKNTQAILDREKNLTIGLLAQSLSHEIRNPLGIIKSSTSVVRNKLDPNSEEFEVAGYLAEEADRISNLIDQLLQLKTDSKHNFEPIDVSQVISQVQLLLKGVCHKYDVELCYDNQAGEAKVACDKNQIKQVLINIILNAIEASDPTEIVQVISQIKSNQYIILVKNKGKVISPGELKKVFNAFHTSKENGSGLGLYVSKHIVESNKGSIQITSDSSKGTVVTISLKLA